jgi:hypothetical protein
MGDEEKFDDSDDDDDDASAMRAVCHNNSFQLNFESQICNFVHLSANSEVPFSNEILTCYQLLITAIANSFPYSDCLSGTHYTLNLNHYDNTY